MLIYVVFFSRVGGDVCHGQVVLTEREGLQYSSLSVSGVFFRVIDLL